MDVLMLAAIVGTVIKIEITGDNLEEEEDIMRQILMLFTGRFGEEE